MCEHLDPAVVNYVMKMSLFYMFETSLLILPYVASIVLNLALWYYIRLYAARSTMNEQFSLVTDDNGVTSSSSSSSCTRSRMKPLDSYHFVLIANNLTDLPLYFLAIIQAFNWYMNNPDVMAAKKPITYLALLIYMFGHSLDFFIYLKFHKQFNLTIKMFFQVYLIWLILDLESKKLEILNKGFLFLETTENVATTSLVDDE